MKQPYNRRPVTPPPPTRRDQLRELIYAQKTDRKADWERTIDRPIPKFRTKFKRQ